LNAFEHICFKHVFDLGNYENVLLAKVIHFFIIQNINALYIDDIDQDIIKNTYIQNTTIGYEKCKN
jgi:hypothetical protein